MTLQPSPWARKRYPLRPAFRFGDTDQTEATIWRAWHFFPPAVSGTGAEAFAAPALSGTGTEAIAGTGALAFLAPTLDGTGSVVAGVTAEGAVTFGAPTFASTGQVIAPVSVAPVFVTGPVYFPLRKRIRGGGRVRILPPAIHGRGLVLEPEGWLLGLDDTDEALLMVA